MTQFPLRFAAAAATLTLALSAPSGIAQDGEASPERARTHLVVGELARLDLARRVLVVKVKPVEKEGVPYEIAIETDEGTRISSRGRGLVLSELRPGERVLVACTDQGTKHHAVLVKMGAPQKIIPSPPGPAASPVSS
jgi:hypothetical protein